MRYWDEGCWFESTGQPSNFSTKFFCLYKKCMSTLLSSFHPPHQSFRAQTALLLLLHHSPDQIYGRVQPISHNTLSRIIYAISCLFFKSFNVVLWKLGSYQWPVLPAFLTRVLAVCSFSSQLCAIPVWIIYRRREMEKPSSLPCRQVPVQILFILCICFFRKARHLLCS